MIGSLFNACYTWDKNGLCTINTSLNGISSQKLGYLTTISSNVQTQIDTTNTSITNLTNSIGNLYNSTCSPVIYNLFSRSVTIGYGSNNVWIMEAINAGIYFSNNGVWKFSYDSNGAYHQLSDRRMKKNLIPIKQDDSLNIIKNLEAYEYNYIDNDLKKSIGFMAQDVEKIDSLAIENHGDILSINYNNLFIHNIMATQHINKRLNTLENFVTEKLNNNLPIVSQINPLDEMNKRLEKLENTITEQQAIIIEQGKLLLKLKKLIK